MTGFVIKVAVLVIVVAATLVVSRQMRRPESNDSLIARVVGGVTDRRPLTVTLFRHEPWSCRLRAVGAGARAVSAS